MEENRPWYAGSLKDWIFTTNHKKIGAMYLMTSLFFFTLAGIFGMIIRYELTSPGIQLPKIGDHEGADLYNFLLTAHGTLMLLWWAIAVWTGGFGNLLIPILIGAKDVAFPRLNAFSYRIETLGSILLSIGILILFINLIYSAKKGKKAPHNPYNHLQLNG
ncbi:MAG: cbb3-type cytochrome c oxidase subunit I [Brevinematia bacterium]